MGPPGGGRTFVTPRFLRHMNLISLTNFDEDTLKLIFGTILTWYMKKSNFNQDLLKFEPKLIFGTLMIYKEVIDELLPTPVKSHYLFNLRDFSKVIFGICMVEKEKL